MQGSVWAATYRRETGNVCVYNNLSKDCLADTKRSTITSTSQAGSGYKLYKGSSLASVKVIAILFILL